MNSCGGWWEASNLFKIYHFLPHYDIWTHLKSFSCRENRITEGPLRKKTQKYIYTLHLPPYLTVTNMVALTPLLSRNKSWMFDLFTGLSKFSFSRNYSSSDVCRFGSSHKPLAENFTFRLVFSWSHAEITELSLCQDLFSTLIKTEL